MIKPEAFVVLNGRPDRAGDAHEWRSCASTAGPVGLTRYKYPRWFNFVDQLPKTTTGKIQRFKLRG